MTHGRLNGSFFETPKRVRWKNRRPSIDLAAERYYIYRLYDEDGQLLYIGRSCNPEARKRSHELSEADWVHLIATMTVDLGGPYTWADACRAERDAITAAKPPHNREFITHNIQ